MDALTNLRKAMVRHTGRELGLRPDIPHMLVEQIRAQGFSADILRLPIDAAFILPMQVLDTASSHFGQTYFVPGIDTPGDPNHPVL